MGAPSDPLSLTKTMLHTSTGRSLETSVVTAVSVNKNLLILHQ